jgi:peptidoglycan hydrolase CwlO-like protein
MPQQISDKTILEAALVGLEGQRARLDEQINSIKKMIGSTKGAVKTPAPAKEAPRRKRVLSAAARKRIAEAQKKRWAAFRKQEGEPEAAPAAKKRAGRKSRVAKAG